MLTLFGVLSITSSSTSIYYRGNRLENKQLTSYTLFQLLFLSLSLKKKGNKYKRLDFSAVRNDFCRPAFFFSTFSMRLYWTKTVAPTLSWLLFLIKDIECDETKQHRVLTGPSHFPPTFDYCLCLDRQLLPLPQLSSMLSLSLTKDLGRRSWASGPASESEPAGSRSRIRPRNTASSSRVAQTRPWRYSEDQITTIS